MLNYGGARMGGILKHDTPNVDVTAREAVQFGGSVVKPAADLPDVGRFAIIADPQGALFVAFTPLKTPAPNDKPGLRDSGSHSQVIA
jgi:hypothetical protein